MLLFCVIILAFIGLGVVLVLYFISPPFTYKIVFTAFILLISLELIWENFYSTKEKKAQRLEGDWTLFAVTSSFLALMYFAIFEFYLFHRVLNLLISGIGFFLYIIGLFLRLWGKWALGELWRVHIIGKDKLELSSSSFIRKGPYKYMRHPMYLGALLEAIGIPLLLNAYYALVFGIIVFWPLEICRTYVEEKVLKQTYSREYIQYKSERWAFLPIKKKWFKLHSTNL